MADRFTVQDNLKRSEETPLQKVKAFSLKDLQRSADQGSREALYELGCRFDEGNGVEKDQAKAVEYWKKAAEKNEPNALYALFLAYANGEGTAEDDDLADDYFEKAVRAGQFDAVMILVDSIVDDDSLLEDRESAAELLRENLAACDPVHLLVVAEKLQESQPQSITAPLAFQCLTYAVQGSHARAQRLLGNAYAMGLGTTKDPAKAIEWWTMAAKQNDLLAIDALLDIYLRGDDTQKDPILARALLQQAADLGDSDAAEALRKFDQGE